MNDHLSDKEQAQLIKDWWKNYGTTILMAILVFVVVNFGMRYWQQYAVKQKGFASIAFSQMLEAGAQNKKDEFKLFAHDLMKNFPRSSYASFAAMLLAQKAVDAGNLDDAQKNLDWAVKHAKQTELRELARVREARILLAMHKPQEALALIKQGTDKFYAAAKHEITGDVFLAENNKKEAAANYRKALDAIKAANAANVATTAAATPTAVKQSPDGEKAKEKERDKNNFVAPSINQDANAEVVAPLLKMKAEQLNS